MEFKTTAEDVTKFVISMAIPFTAAFIGSIATSSSVSTWYQTLVKPSFNPPNWVFGPVWTILYALMGVSLFLVWKKGIKTSYDRLAIAFFAIQLAINVFWSFVFFGLQAPAVGLFTILLLLPMILIMIIKFYRIDKWAGYLNIPYLLWVSFATILNLAIVILN